MKKILQFLQDALVLQSAPVLQNALARGSQGGQAMAEFVILLTVIMIMCSGMLYSSRLLTFDFWAQQEARYMAYEQVWYSRWANGAAADGDATDELGDTQALRRPRLLDQLNVDRTHENKEGVNALLPLIAKAKTGANPRENGDEWMSDILNRNNEHREDVPAAIMLAQRQPEESFWKGKTREWFYGNRFSLVRSAFASQRWRDTDKELSGDWPDMEREESNRIPGDRYPQTDLEQGFVKMLVRNGFGEDYCAASRHLMKSRGMPMAKTTFAREDCAEYFDREFGTHLGENLNINSLFTDYAYQLDGGRGSGEGFGIALEKEIASQFYSFFDTAVSAAMPLAPADITLGSIMAGPNAVADLSGTSLLRYLGSDIALGIIGVEFAILIADVTLGGQMNRDWQAELTSEQNLNDILHADGSNPAGLPGGLSAFNNGFHLSPNYLPVPLTMLPVAPALFEWTMHSVLASDRGDWSELVDDTNKFETVSYEDGNGVFPAARSRFRTGDKTLTARHYLVTQPWHITRRESPDGPWRSLGGQGSSIDDPTDEGILRRRTLNLYLFPTNFGDLIALLGADIPGMSTVAPLLQGFDTIISTVKEFVFDNFLIDALNGLNDLMSRIGADYIDFSFPYFPAVRPQAYPHSVEINGDMKTGSSRTFADYIDEQDDANNSGGDLDEKVAQPEFH